MLPVNANDSEVLFRRVGASVLKKQFRIHTHYVVTFHFNGVLLLSSAGTTGPRELHVIVTGDHHQYLLSPFCTTF
jgi:hypothetical protein